MPPDAVIILVVVHCQASLVMELLEAFNGDSDVVVRLDRALLNSLEVVGLRLALLPVSAPESLRVRLGKQNINIDGLNSWSNH